MPSTQHANATYAESHLNRQPTTPPERLELAAIRRDNVVIIAPQRRTHYALRQWAWPDQDPQYGRPNDVEGFWTDDGRFVTRKEAVYVAILAGQLSVSWANVSRPLLSSDINWEGRQRQ